jgi:hypothetical protein
MQFALWSEVTVRSESRLTRDRVLIPQQQLVSLISFSLSINKVYQQSSAFTVKYLRAFEQQEILLELV